MLAHENNQIAVYNPHTDCAVVLRYDAQGYYYDMIYFYFDTTTGDLTNVAYNAKAQFMTHGALAVWDYHTSEILRDASFTDLVTYAKGMRYQQFVYGAGVVSGAKFGHTDSIYIA